MSLIDLFARETISTMLKAKKVGRIYRWWAVLLVATFPRERNLLVLDFGRRTVLRRSETITVTTAGFEILSTLLQHATKSVRREDLANQLWGDDPPASDTLRSQIYKLRKAVDKPYAEKLLHTIVGTGYRIGKDDPDVSTATYIDTVLFNI